MTERIVTGSNGRKYITNEPLLRSPHQQWSGLTDEEIGAATKDIRGIHCSLVDQIARAVEAKLKEKNFS